VPVDPFQPLFDLRVLGCSLATINPFAAVLRRTTWSVVSTGGAAQIHRRAANLRT
jgi:hypothetical protein